MGKALCLVGGFVLGWAACITQALIASKGLFNVKPIPVDSDIA